MLKLSDREVIIKIKNGEIDYFSYLVQKYSGQIYNYVYKKIFDKNEIDDLVQNIFLSFYKAIGRFDEKRVVGAYLYQIARNELRMYFRSHKKTLQLDEKILIENKEDELYILHDFEKLISSLPNRQKKALKLLTEGYSYKEIAHKLGKPLNTIKTLIRRARLAVSKTQNENNRK